MDLQDDSPTESPRFPPSRNPSRNPSRIPTNAPTWIKRQCVHQAMVSSSENSRRSPTWNPARSPPQNPANFPIGTPLTSPSNSPTSDPADCTSSGSGGWCSNRTQVLWSKVLACWDHWISSNIVTCKSSSSKTCTISNKESHRSHCNSSYMSSNSGSPDCWTHRVGQITTLAKSQFCSKGLTHRFAWMLHHSEPYSSSSTDSQCLSKVIGHWSLVIPDTRRHWIQQCKHQGDSNPSDVAFQRIHLAILLAILQVRRFVVTSSGSEVF